MSNVLVFFPSISRLGLGKGSLGDECAGGTDEEGGEGGDLLGWRGGGDGGEGCGWRSDDGEAAAVDHGGGHSAEEAVIGSDGSSQSTGSASEEHGVCVVCLSSSDRCTCCESACHVRHKEELVDVVSVECRR